MLFMIRPYRRFSVRCFVDLDRTLILREGERGMPVLVLSAILEVPTKRPHILCREGDVPMKQQGDGFKLRTYSRFPIRTSLIYMGQDFAGQGVIRELSRVGCRILGDYPVTPG